MIAALLILIASIQDRACLVRQTLVESQAESYSGQVEVAGVIKKRMRKTGMTACAVIAAPGQFGDREIRLTGKSLASALRATGAPSRCNATHFDVIGSEEAWTRTFKLKCVIGHHQFFAEQ